MTLQTPVALSDKFVLVLPHYSFGQMLTPLFAR